MSLALFERMSRHARLLATILALAPAAAHADPAPAPLKLAILAGPGVRVEWLRDDSDTYSKVRMLPSLAATVAYRLSPHFALGIHANAARYSDEVIHPDETLRWNVISVDRGIVDPPVRISWRYHPAHAARRAGRFSALVSRRSGVLRRASR